jgi:hypothetical protein
MLNRRAVLIVVLLLVLGGFIGGIIYLFNLRFSAGDMYPHYSTLRSDPLGCRVYFDSLGRLGHARVQRFIQSIEKLPHGRDVTFFVFGLPWSEMAAEPDEYKALETFVRDGGRLVVTLYPEVNKPRVLNSASATNGPTFKTPPGNNDWRRPRVNLRETWGFDYEFVPTQRGGQALKPMMATRVGDEPLPATVVWHSALVFTNLSTNWNVIYARGTNPVLIARRHGSGSIVLATDSFFVSNEAMRNERRADLLAWLPGGSAHVLFDETHLGVQEQPGLAQLARRYQLHGAALSLLALAALFIWKSSMSFVPRTSESSIAAPVMGRDSAAGFENLLRRSIAPKDLLQASLDEWHKAAQLDRRNTPARREKIRAVVAAFNAAESPDLAATYREIVQILNRKK